MSCTLQATYTYRHCATDEPVLPYINQDTEFINFHCQYSVFRNKVCSVRMPKATLYKRKIWAIHYTETLNA